MNWTDIVVALLAMIGTLIGSVYGIRKSNSLVEYRLQELEKKVDKHNNIVERLTVAEHTIKAISATCDKFNDRIISNAEKLDIMETDNEKTEGRIKMLEHYFVSKIGDSK